MPELRALTVRQPWAWAIAFGGKDVENRSRRTTHRGLLAIHAGKAVHREGLEDPRVLEAIASQEFEINEAASRLGAVIAVAELYSCHQWPGAGSCNGQGGPPCSPWASPDSWHWLLRDVRPLRAPVPCKGKLGLWRLPEHVEKDAREQLEEGT